MKAPRFTLLALLPALTVLLCPLQTSARDYVLTVGGGYSPAGNQVSLERNVLFFRKLLSEKYPGEAKLPHDLYFADGDSPNPDLNYIPEDQKSPHANRLIAMIFGKEEHLGLHYRSNELENMNGVSSPENLEKWFKESGSKLHAGDRLILYITAHGGRSSDKKNKHNTKLYMWNTRSIDARTLANHLKSLPEGVEVMTVMVQCYSGGFANLLFEEADSTKGPGARPVCGFFATVHDRIAAGCTPDINEENYDEFSSHFWAAIRGTTRTDKSVPSADYDGDGEISFEEAHAYTLLASQSVDIPIKTTDAFLRKHSKISHKDHPNLLSLESPYFQLLTKARPVELAVLDGLSARLGLVGVDRISQAQETAKKLAESRKQAQSERDAHKKRFEDARRKIRRDLKNRWPFLENSASTGTLELFTSKSAELVKAIEGHANFKELMDARKQRGEHDHKRFELDKKWAHHQRFLRVVETLVLANNLSSVASEDIQKRYTALLAREQGSLGKRETLAAKDNAPKETPPEKKESVASTKKEE